MPNITLTIPEKTFALMKKHKEIRWSEVARQAIENLTRKLTLLDEADEQAQVQYFNDLLKDSELTEDDVEKLDNLIKENILKRILAK